MSKVLCPLCGSKVRDVEATPLARYVCNKCHTPFHLSKTLRPVIGPPPDVELEVEALKQQFWQALEHYKVKKVAIGLVALLALGWFVSYLMRPSDALKPAAQLAADAFAKDNLGYLKSIAVPGTEDDVRRWYDELHNELIKQRGRWRDKPETIDVAMGKDEMAERKGSTAFSVHPATGNARDVSLARPEEQNAGNFVSVDGMMHWVLSKRGHWELDGRETYERVRPAPAEPSPGSQVANSTARK